MDKNAYQPDGALNEKNPPKGSSSVKKYQQCTECKKLFHVGNFYFDVGKPFKCPNCSGLKVCSNCFGYFPQSELYPLSEITDPEKKYSCARCVGMPLGDEQVNCCPQCSPVMLVKEGVTHELCEKCKNGDTPKITKITEYDYFAVTNMEKIRSARTLLSEVRVCRYKDRVAEAFRILDDLVNEYTNLLEIEE